MFYHVIRLSPINYVIILFIYQKTNQHHIFDRMYQNYGICRERKSQNERNEREDYVTLHLVTL